MRKKGDFSYKSAKVLQIVHMATQIAILVQTFVQLVCYDVITDKVKAKGLIFLMDALALAGLGVIFLNCVWSLAESAKEKRSRKQITAQYYKQRNISQ